MFLSFVSQLWKKPGKKPQPGKVTRPAIKPGAARWEATILPLDHSGGRHVQDGLISRIILCNWTNLKEIDRQWIVQELNFYLINVPFRMVHLDDITSKFDNVASFCYRFSQLDTNLSLHKELPTSGLRMSSLVHTLKDNSVVLLYTQPLYNIKLIK